MAETTGIAYVRHSRNYWSGCTKISPGCDDCFAEVFSRRIRGKNPDTGQAMNWGVGAPRTPHLAGAVRDLQKWNRAAKAEGQRRRVFINTNSDTFDNEVQDAWRWALYGSIAECPNLDFLLVTKRIGNVERMVPASWMMAGFPVNVRLLITVVNQQEAERDVHKLLALPCRNGISYAPGLGPIDWFRLRCPYDPALTYNALSSREGIGLRQADGAVRHVEWIVVEGERAQPGRPARPFDLEWVRQTIAQGRGAGVPVFVKQVGSNPIVMGGEFTIGGKVIDPPQPFRVHFIKDRAGADPAEWPEDLRVRQFPD